jgi:hypothetical protein
MTEENYQYRTSQEMLRNQFEGEGAFQIPIIPKASFSDEDFRDLLLIGFDRAKEGIRTITICKIHHRRIAFAGKQWYYYQKRILDLHRQRHGQCIWRTMEAESQQA